MAKILIALALLLLGGCGHKETWQDRAARLPYDKCALGNLPDGCMCVSNWDGKRWTPDTVECDE